MNVGQIIHDLREKNNLTQKQLADQLFVTAQAVSRWEKGIVEPGNDTIKKLAEIFHVSTDVILGSAPIESDKQVVEQQVVEPMKRQIGVCEDCNKPILEGEPIHRVHRSHHSDRVLCEDCFIKENRQSNEFDLKELKKKRKKAWIWSIIIGSLLAIASIVICCFMKTTNDVLIALFVGLGISVLFFTFLFCCIMDNNFIGDLYLDVVELGFVKMPGVIFSMSFDGIVFLILTKAFLFILGILLAIGAAILGLLICLPMSLFTFPYALVKGNREIKKATKDMNNGSVNADMD